MLIREIHIHNFQIHKDLVLKLTTGVNIILGDTDKGKSAIIRALKLLLDNQPRSGEVIYQNRHHKKDPLSIKVIDVKGNVIERKKRKYYINGELLKAYGTDVPLPVKELLPFKDINWQRQLEQHFLILQTGGGAAKILNSSTGMEDQELLLKEVKSAISESKSNIKRIKKNNTEHQETINRLKNVNRFLEDALHIKLLENQSEDLIKSSHQLGQLLTQLYQCLKNKQNIDTINSRLNEIDLINNKMKSLKGKEAIINGLRDLLDHLKLAQEEIKNKDKYNKHLHSINLIFKNQKEYSNLSSLIQQLFKLVQNLKQIKKDIKSAKVNHEQLKKKLNDYLLNLGYCPTCGQKVKGGHVC